MPLSRTLKRSYNAVQLGLQAGNATTGIWATQLSSNKYSLHKAAAASTSVVNIAIPHGPRGGLPTNEDAQISIVEMFYLVATADLTSAPTVSVNQHTFPGGAGTGTVAANTVTNVLTFAGVDTIGKTSTSGNHIAVVTFSTAVWLPDTDSLIIAYTMGEAATSVLDIFGITVTYV